MRLSILALTTVASATSSTLLDPDLIGAFPLIQVLPVPGWNTSAGGFNSLGNIYTSSAGQLSSQANAIAQTNAALNGSGSIQYSYDVKASLASSLATVNNLFWQTAYQAQLKVCSITTSINQQNVNTVNGNLRAGITAEVQAVIAIATAIQNTVAAIKTQAVAFTDAEKAVIAAAVQAIATAAVASLGPVATLSSGLTAIGATGVSDVVQSLQDAVASLQAAAAIDWNTS